MLICWYHGDGLRKITDPRIRILHGACEHAMAYARETVTYLTKANSVSTIISTVEVFLDQRSIWTRRMEVG